MSLKEPAYIRAFKAITKGEPTKEDLERVETEMYGASDRASVIVLVAFLETAFGAYVHKLLRADLTPDERRILFDLHGPLGTFSSQIAVAYALGAIGKLTRDDLGIVRTVRNGAAHSRKIFSFASKEVQDICSQLRIPDSGEYYLDTKYIESVTGKHVEIGTRFEDKSAKTRFFAAVHTIAANTITPKEPKRVAMIIPYYLP